MATNQERIIRSLQLFCRLTKDGCKWHGDVVPKKWSECLYFESDFVEAKARQTLAGYVEGEDFKYDNGCVWIC